MRTGPPAGADSRVTTAAGDAFTGATVADGGAATANRGALAGAGVTAARTVPTPPTAYSCVVRVVLLLSSLSTTSPDESTTSASR